ncbi:hypothetical protein [Spirosoma rhododendri]|uniref:Uncharacterized protein n=1 Tax=Spirosoma rhododendri TaxID=2728024 RepID=A0A7L5DRT4_9BACT|nr:hypothetical protein [Spirosoma rhododendri]QJD80151.1 hypothetical protein HH216_18335 [Spirosoma rhododendri]
MKSLYVLLMLAAYQTYGQTPGQVRPDSMPVARPERGSKIILRPNNFSDSVTHELLKSLPNADRGKPDDMPVARPERGSTIPMPTTVPDNAFYRSPKDPSNVVRATLDNMPIHGYDTTKRHSSAIRRIRPRK